mgnify:FL=1
MILNWQGLLNSWFDFLYLSFYKMNKKTILIGSAAALSLTGLAWKVIENEILYLKSRAVIHETAAARAKNPQDKVIYAELSDRLARRANLFERIQLFSPWTYIVPYTKKLYNMYLRRSYKEAGKY